MKVKGDISSKRIKITSSIMVTKIVPLIKYTRWWRKKLKEWKFHAIFIEWQKWRFRACNGRKFQSLRKKCQRQLLNHCNVFCDDGQIFMVFQRNQTKINGMLSCVWNLNEEKWMGREKHMLAQSYYQRKMPGLKWWPNRFLQKATTTPNPIKYTKFIRPIYVNVLILPRLLFLWM